MTDGHLETDHPIDGIDTGGSFRRDLGDIDALAESMTRLGLLTPLVVTDGGQLVCGRRRLAAARQLGWTSIPAWVPDKVSENLRLAAMVDDHSLAKTLTPTEQADLYAEYEKLYATQARLRQEATRFGGGATSGASGQTDGADGDGGVESTPPPELAGRESKSRIKAAVAVTGTDSHERLEHIRELQAIARDPDEDPMVRQDAAEALVELDHDGKVNPRWQRVKLSQHLVGLEGTAVNPTLPDPVRQAAADALAAARAQPTPADALREAKHGLGLVDAARSANPPPPKPVDPDAEPKRRVRLLVDVVRREHGWWDHDDPAEFGAYADPAQWELVESYRRGINGFLDQAQPHRPAA